MQNFTSVRRIELEEGYTGALDDLKRFGYPYCFGTRDPDLLQLRPGDQIVFPDGTVGAITKILSMVDVLENQEWFKSRQYPNIKNQRAWYEISLD